MAKRNLSLDIQGISEEELQSIARTLGETPEEVIRLVERHDMRRDRERRNKKVQRRKSMPARSTVGVKEKPSIPKERESPRRARTTYNGLYDSDDIRYLDKNGIFSAVTEEKARSIHSKCRSLLKGPYMQQDACCICDELVLHRHSRVVTVSEDWIERCVNRLKPSPDIPIPIVKYYDVSDLIPSLEGALLSRKGIVDVNGGNQFRICKRCYQSMRDGEACRQSKPPKFSIANGFTLGCLPEELQDVTEAEIRLSSLANVSPPIYVVRGGRHKAIGGHVTIFDSRPREVLDGINEVVADEDKILVILTSPMTDKQRRLTMRRFEVRKSKITGLLEHFEQNHSSYIEGGRNNMAVSRRLELLRSASQEELNRAVVTHTIEDPQASAHIDADQESVRLPSCLRTVAAEEDEERWQNDGSVFIDHDASTVVGSLEVASAKILDIERAGALVRDSEPDLLARVFPDLFPYGCGYPGTAREVKVSFGECCAHYIRLSTRRFSQHPTFVLVAFDMVSRRRAIMSIVVSCRLRPHEVDKINEVTGEELSACWKENAQRLKDFQNGIQPVSASRGGNDRGRAANVLLRKVTAATGYSLGRMKSEERISGKHVAYYAGHIKTQTLEEVKIGDVPSHARRVELAGCDPFACDLYFSNVLEIFFTEVIGYDRDKKVPKEGGGLFGVVKAFVGGIESQAKKTLHVHAILYLAGLPRTCDDFITECESPAFRKRLAAFADSVVQHTSSIDGSIRKCVECGCSKTISAVQFPSRAFRSGRTFSAPPTTAHCEVCNRYYSHDEILRQAAQDMQTELITSGSLDLSVWETDDWQTCDRQTEQDSCVPSVYAWGDENDDDATHLSKELRLLRLLLLCQKHNWRHTNSCFKISCNAGRAECRYRFQRETVPDTTVCNKKGILIHQRHVGNEYLNAYNRVVLDLFRSNHDVRLLVGSSDELYYALKYSVNYQNTTDNVASLSLAAFDKRLARERRQRIRNAEERELTSGNDRSVAIGRIASLTHARTSKQEVGAAMAAHYLLHKTTFVSSHNFARLPLYAFLSELDDEENSVSLIPSSNGQFRPVSRRKITNVVPWNLRIQACMNSWNNTRSQEVVTKIMMDKTHPPLFRIVPVVRNVRTNCGISW